MTDQELKSFRGIIVQEYVSNALLEELLVQALKNGDGVKAVRDARVKIPDSLASGRDLTPEERAEIHEFVKPFFNGLEARLQGKNLHGFDLDLYVKKDFAMNRFRRIVLLIGFLIVAGFCLRPPYQWEQEIYLVNRRAATFASYKTGTQVVTMGHHWIWRPPEGWTAYEYEGVERTIYVASIDWTRLIIYVGLTIGACAFIVFAGNPWKGFRLTNRKGLTQ
jgi:hypothetical protein